VQKLISGEEILRGYLGVQIQPMNDDLAAALGLEHNRGEFIQSVQPGEAAEQAGLQSGDVVLAVNGTEVTPEQTLSFLVANIEPGRRVPLEVVRDGQRRTVQVTVGRRPSPEQLAAQSFGEEEEGSSAPTSPSTDNASVVGALGVQAIPLNVQIARQLGMPDSTQGLVVSAVDPNSDAARKGLTRGTIIISANGRDMTQISDLEAVIRSAQSEGREAVLLRVRSRGGPAISVPVRLR
jgi:serine protease Do